MDSVGRRGLRRRGGGPGGAGRREGGRRRAGRSPGGRRGAGRAGGSRCAAGLAVGLLLVLPATLHAHLRNVGGSLVDLLGASDGVIVARTVEATRDAPAAHTSMHVARGLAGTTPDGDFRLQSASSPMRYAAGQIAIVALARESGRWEATQSAGEGLVLEEGGEIDPATAEFVASVWKALHDPEGATDLGAVLRRGLRLPHPKIRLLVAVDLAELTHHDPGLTAETRSGLEADLRDPDLDPVARLVLSRALGAGGR